MDARCLRRVQRMVFGEGVVRERRRIRSAREKGIYPGKLLT